MLATTKLEHLSRTIFGSSSSIVKEVGRISEQNHDVAAAIARIFGLITDRTELNSGRQTAGGSVVCARDAYESEARRARAAPWQSSALAVRGSQIAEDRSQALIASRRHLLPPPVRARSSLLLRHRLAGRWSYICSRFLKNFVVIENIAITVLYSVNTPSKLNNFLQSSIVWNVKEHLCLWSSCNRI